MKACQRKLSLKVVIDMLVKFELGMNTLCNVQICPYCQDVMYNMYMGNMGEIERRRTRKYDRQWSLLLNKNHCYTHTTLRISVHRSGVVAKRNDSGSKSEK